MQIVVSEETHKAVEAVIRKGFRGKVDGIKIERDIDHDGKDCLRITVYLSKDATRDDYKGFFGLTARVRKALGEKNNDLFPYIRPTGQPIEEAYA